MIGEGGPSMWDVDDTIVVFSRRIALLYFLILFWLLMLCGL